MSNTFSGAVLVLSLASPALADVRLPALISDHMVLQQGQRARIWGSADPGERVAVQVAGAKASATTDAAGHWEVQLGPLAAGGPHVLEIQGKNAVRVDDVLVGEVWLASGQSNMEFPLDRAVNAATVIPAATFPQIREFAVPKAISRTPLAEVSGEWHVCSPASAGTFSAVAFFFARDLQTQLKVPVAIIHSSWGGTPAEAWTSRAALVAQPDLRPMVEHFDASVSDPNAIAAYMRSLEAWQRANVAYDTGNEGFAKGWARPDFNASTWRSMNAPGAWEGQGLGIDGAVWFRRTIEIPATWIGTDLQLSLGAIDDFDTTYFDGQEIGHTGIETLGYWSHARHYLIPKALVHAGKATIAVRAFDLAGDGGFMGPGAMMRIASSAGGEALSLAGPWAYQVERGVGPLQPDWGSQPAAPESQNSPALLFNAMIAPLTRYTLRGAIWYQGEANAERAAEYRHLFPVMIRDWRHAFGLGDFPFLFVQLANFMARAAEPGDSSWAELREAQRQTLREPNTGMAVTIDVGEADDIHPRNKQAVGQRLARWALAGTYARQMEASGPLYASHKVEGAQVRVHFAHGAGLRVSDGTALSGFAIAGADHRFVWADATIAGEDVLVSSPSVSAPVAVRYGWADNPRVNLVNGADLPASPFRTDD